MNKKIILTSAAVLPFLIGTVNAESLEGVVTSYGLNVRSGPDKSYSVKFQLSKGDKVTIENSSNGWYKITASNGKKGWVSSKYIDVIEKETTTIKQVSVSSLNMRTGPSTSYKIITVLNKGDEVEVISIENGWAKIKYNSKTGYVSNSYLTDKTTSSVKIKYVNSKGLNVRSGPSTSYKVIDVYRLGQKVEVVSVDGKWAKIKYGNGYAYISNRYLVDEPIDKTDIKYVNVGSLNVRSGPSTSYKILAVYKLGQKVEVVSIDGVWAKIKYNSGYAYVSNKYLTDKIPNNDNNDNSNESNNVSGETETKTTYENLNYSFDDMVNYEYKLAQKGYNKIRANLSTNYSSSKNYINATKADLEKYLNPSTFSTNSKGKLQFLKLDRYRTGITASELNQYFSKKCSSKSVFLNKGQAFIDAAKKYDLDVAYLVAASMLETGYGTSELAQGVYVTTSSGEKVKVYNFFGISAYDGTAVSSASQYAYKKGWTTIDKTIDGSAKWIADNYIHSSKYNQNTLYKMRWIYNTGHQYATDVDWANFIGKLMNDLVPYYGNSTTLEYLIPKYK